MKTQKESLLSQRGQMAMAELVLWFLLALWCISAFWQHINELKPDYPIITKLGAMSGEVAALILVLWHCFNKHINVRKWSLIFMLVLSPVLLIHAGALRGLREAQTAQFNAEQRLADTLTRMSKEQAAGIKSIDTGTQRERLAKSAQAVRQQGEVAKSAQQEVAKTITTGADKIKDSSMLPRWYLDDWMYSLLFVLSLLCVSIPAYMLTNKEDIDTNFDGIADHLQQEGRAVTLPGRTAPGFAQASRGDSPKAQSDQE